MPDDALSPDEGVGTAKGSRGPITWRVGSVLAVSFLSLLVLAAVFAPWVIPYSFGFQDHESLLVGPSAGHLFGTDALGRDILSRLIYGARPTLVVAAGSAMIGAVLGVAVGLTAGYFGRWSDAALMRTMDLLLGIPGVLLAMTIIAIGGRSTATLTMAIGIVGIPVFARLARAGTLVVKGMAYVKAAKIAGAGSIYLMTRSILPNIAGVVLVQLNIFLASAILIEASLSFLGLGLPPPTPTWGGMLLDSRAFLSHSPTYGLFPGLILTATILSFDTIARSLRYGISAPGQRSNASIQNTRS